MSKYRFVACVCALMGPVAVGDLLVLNDQGIDHPDGNRNPPPYGLRLDGLFSQAADVGSFAGGVGGVGKDTTFSFQEYGSNVRVKVFEVNTGDSDTTNDYRIEISGTVFGGQDDGDDAASDFGAGFYDILFSYSVNVAAVADGWIVNPNSASNTGFIESTGTTVDGVGNVVENTDVPAGNKWFMFDQVDNNNNSFVLRSDNHRSPGIPHNLVARGWVTLNSDGSNFGDSGSTQDWLFVTIPLPLGSTMTLAGLSLIALRRRR